MKRPIAALPFARLRAQSWRLGLGALLVALVAAGAGAAKAPRAPRQDRYGGVRPRAGRATGYFRLVRRGSRWLFLSPEGDPFWLRSVYAVNWGDGGPVAHAMLARKYGGRPRRFARHAAERLLAWGFNSLGEYSSVYTLPLPTYFHPHGNSVRLPFIRLLNISWYGAIDQGHLAPAPFKTLLAGAVDPKYYSGWAGNVPDVFDPNFAIYARNAAADRATSSNQTIFTARSTHGGLPQPSLVHTPWLIGTTPDDADNLFGFGPGPRMPGPDGVVHPNIAWIIAVTKPLQHRNTQVGAAFGDRHTEAYPDPTVYAKRAWARFLRREYHTIAALNAAWGSNYTTFGSDGAWPNGRGLLDESGRHRWMGREVNGRLSGASPRLHADLNRFLGVYADRYFRIVSQAIRAATPHQLVFSPAELDSHGGLTRRPILMAAAKYCDAIQVDADPRHPAPLVQTWAWTHRPMFTWIAEVANPDSAMHRFHASFTPWLHTQAQRGAAYAREVHWLYAFSVDGVHPFVGLDWWEYMDKWGERANWGLVTPRDNAYDGREDRIARGRDRWGVPYGGESRNYGDFLTAAVAANQRINRQLARLMRGATGKRSRGAARRRPGRSGKAARP